MNQKKLLLLGLTILAFVFVFSLAASPAAAQVVVPSTLTVDLSGTWNKDITVQLWSSDRATLLWSQNNQHGGVRNYSVNPGTYDIKLVQGPQAYWVDDLDCSGNCNAGDFTGDLKVDLSGTWNKDITVQLKTADDQLIWSVNNQHGGERHYNVLKSTYDVSLIQGPATFDVNDIDCAGETCDAGDVAESLTVDLSGTWLKDITVQLFVNDGAMIWSVNNQHGGVRVYNVLKNTYDLKLVQGPAFFDVANIDCSAGACSAADFTGDLKVDLSGTWHKDITVQLKTADGQLIWSVNNQHGGERHYNVLKNTYDISLIQGPATFDVNDLNCTGATCDAGDVAESLTVDLSGTWNKDITVQLFADGGGQIWSVNNQHGGVRVYNVLKNTYDLKLVQGPASFDVADINCGAGACDAGDVAESLTVDLSGTWNKDITVQLYVDGGALIWSVNNQHGGVRVYNVLKNAYDLRLVQGPKNKDVADIDCANGPTNCNAGDFIAQLTVIMGGYSGVTAQLNLDDGSPGTPGSLIWGVNNQSGTPVYNVLKNTYDVTLVLGGKSYLWDAVNCTGETCLLDKSSLTVNFPGINGVHVYLYNSNGVAGTVSGATKGTQTYKNNQAVFTNLANGKYDVKIVQGAMVKIVDDVAVLGNFATVDNIVATLTANFPGINGVHTYVKTFDNVANTFGGGDVTNRTYQNNTTSMAVLRGVYDVKVVQGAQQNIYDGVDCSGATCAINDLVATLTVNFPGINGVHTYVKTTGGGDVTNRTYQNGTTSMAVLKGAYNVKVVQGAQQNTYNVDCTSGACTLTDIVATLTVNFPGINGVHTYVKTFDNVAGVFGGGDVTNRTYQNGTTSMAVLKGVYDVKVVQGAQQNVYDGVDCSSGACTVTDIVATLTVDFPGINGVHTYVKTFDNNPGVFGGGDVTNRTYQNGTTSMVVLKGVYDVKVVQGAQQNVYDGVDCSSGTCAISDIVATLTVNFPGINGVHTYVKTFDNNPGVFGGGDVTNRTYQNGTTSMAVLKGTYDVKVVQGAQQSIYDGVDCTGNTCVINGIVSNFTLHFPGKTGVHVYVKLNDGVVNAAGGGDVTNRTYQNNKTTMTLIKGTYDLVVNIAGVNYIVDAVDITADPAVYSLALVKFINSTGGPIAGGVVQYYASGWKNLGSTPAGGVLAAAIPGAPGNFPFSMNYAFARQEKSQNIATDLLVVFQTAKVVVELRDSANALMDTGTVQYYTNGWHDIGATASGVVNIELLPLNYTFSMNYAYARQEKSQNVGSNATVVFKTVDVEVQLQNSNGATGALPSEGTVQYYTNGWHDIGATASGVVNIELLPLNYTFSMNYAFARQEKSQNVGSDDTVVFKTVDVEVQLQDSNGATGALPSEGTVQYYTNGWHDIGATASGVVNIELLPLNYTFSMNYAFARQEKSQNVGSDDTVVFKTVDVEVQLQDSNGATGALPSEGTVQYYTNGWHDVGATASGVVNIELLPLNYPFSMTYAFARQEKSQNVGSNPTVVFKTGQVHSQSATATNYYANGWRPFTQDMELLPGSYPFKFSGGAEMSYAISAGVVNNIQ